MKIRFLLVGEGSSDLALVDPLERLFIRCGASEVIGIAPDLTRLPQPPGKTVGDQIRAAYDLEPRADFILVHRDADNLSREERDAQILRAAGAGDELPVIPVVPVTMTEAWVLLDEKEIRRVAGNPSHGQMRSSTELTGTSSKPLPVRGVRSRAE